MAEILGQTVEVTEEDFSNFIGKNSDQYLPHFKKFHVDGSDKFVLTWNWAACLLGFWWMLYRKLYAWALIAFFLVFIPFWVLLGSIVYGVIANYIYYKHAKKKIIECKNNLGSLDPSKVEFALHKIGGVQRGLIPIFAAIAWLAIIFFLQFPSISDYRTKSYDSLAKEDLYNAAFAQEAYFKNHGTYADSYEKLAGAKYRLYHTQDVVITVLRADTHSYSMSAYHAKGNKRFVLNGPDREMHETDMEERGSPMAEKL